MQPIIKTDDLTVKTTVNDNDWIIGVDLTEPDPERATFKAEAVNVRGKDIISLNTIADMKLKEGSYNGQGAVLNGFYVNGDGGGGEFYWNSTYVHVGTDIDGMIVYVDDVSVGAWIRIYGDTVHVRWCGAKGDDFTLDTDPIKGAFSLQKNVDYGNGTYLVDDQIPIHSNTEIFAVGAVIKWTGDDLTPLYTNNSVIVENITFKGGLYIGGDVSLPDPRLKEFVYLEGAQALAPTNDDYCKNIQFDFVDISGAQLFINAQKAVRKLFITNCDVFTDNCILGEGKLVETKITGSVLFGATLALGTYGIKLVAHPDGGGSDYPEGMHIDNCTVDNYDKTILVQDIFVFEINNSFIGKYSNGSIPILFKKSVEADDGFASNLCKDIIFSNNTIKGGIEIGGTSSGFDYEMIISDNLFLGAEDTSIYIKNNTAGISINNNKFASSVDIGNTIALLLDNNVSEIDYSYNEIDNTYLRVLTMSGTNGGNITALYNKSEITTPYFISRPVFLRYTGQVNDTLSTDLTGSVVAGNFFGESITVTAAKGEKLLINISLNITNTSAGRMKLVLPTGLEAPSGSGWNALFFNIPTLSTADNKSVSIPMYCNSDVLNGIVSIKNEDAGTVTATFHSNFSILRI